MSYLISIPQNAADHGPSGREAATIWARVAGRLRDATLPRAFLIAGTIIAVAYCFVVPPFEVTDEDRHFWRAYSVSQLHFLGQEQTVVPSALAVFHDAHLPALQRRPDRRRVSAQELKSWLNQPAPQDDWVSVRNPAANLYAFVPYLPTAFTLRAVGAVRAPPILQFYCGRLANALTYLILIYAALRITPVFQLLFCLIAATPTSLHLAASFSADAVTLGLAAVVVAYIFRLAFGVDRKSVRAADVAAVLGLLGLLTLCKFNPWFSLLTALVPSAKFSSRRRFTFFVVGAFALCCAAGAGWQSLNHAATTNFVASRAAHGSVVADNVAFLQQHPVWFLRSVIVTCYSMWLAWVWGATAVFGWVTAPLPGALVAAYVFLVLLTTFYGPGVSLTGRQRLLLGAVVALTIVSVNALLWSFHLDQPLLQRAATEGVEIPGVQGRYFLSIAVPLFAMCATRRRSMTRATSITVFAAAMLINGCAIWVLRTIYYF